ncbi:sialic acid-binding Ig-like lectin 11 [Artibeus jamaicensis]|uniref:sialic acid-binding Ig-like lectin 11 n=1 Tax=Artibeus jamaicensis TaxID=9417 RepID=UPI00235A9E1B|nr:sialic acid-binding Ig-like lectin 11 [Artibeus jamaicensis]
MVSTPISSRSFLLELPSRLDRQVQKPNSPETGPVPETLEMLRLLLPLLWAGSLGKDPGYVLQVPKSVTVQEGLCFRVPCTVTYPHVGWDNSTPAHGSWFLKKDNLTADLLVATNKKSKKAKRKPRFSFYFSGDPGDNNCSLSITDAQKSHRGKYYFRLESGSGNHSYQSNLVTVDVAELTQIPDIRVKEPLEAGCPAHLTCSMPGACEPLTISWTGVVLRPLGLDQAAYNSSEILLSPRPQDHGTNLTCRVTFPRTRVSRERTLTLNVSYAPRNLTISVFRGSPTELEYVGNGSSLPVREGDSLGLLCVADSNPPATLSWARGSRTLSPLKPWNPGVLQLSRVESQHEGEFSCQAQHPRGSLRVSLHLSVHYPPRLLGTSCSWEDEGLRCSCSSRAEPAPSLRWRLGERLLEGNHSNASYTVTSSSEGPWANSSLSLRAGLSAGLRLSCEVQNVHGAQSASVLLLPGKPELGKAFFLGAVGGAGAAGLLSLCLGFIFFKVKTRRKDAPEAAAGGKDAPSRLGPTSRGYQHKCLPGSHRDHPSPAPAAPTSGEEHELHYASLSFQELRPCERPDQEATSTTEYAEIKIRE